MYRDGGRRTRKMVREGKMKEARGRKGRRKRVKMRRKQKRLIGGGEG